MQYIRSLLANIRLSLWWHHIVAPLLGVLYLLLLLGEAVPQEVLRDLSWLTISILGTASLGYWINDWTDLEQDLLVGKKNATVGYSLLQKTLILLALSITAAGPWVFLPRSFLSFDLWMVLILTFILYSIPPFRLKERAFWGALCDMSYGHLLPVWITIAVFQEAIHVQWQAPQLTAGLICLVLILKGLRNIIQHQLEDRKKDQQLDLHTFVEWLGPYRSAMLISFVILPLELFALSTLLWNLHPALVFFFLFFLLTYAWRIWSWKFYRSRSIRQIFRLWFVLNDYYEASFPLSVLLLLFIYDPQLVFIGGLHLLFFPKTLDHWKWVGKTWVHLELWRELRKYIVMV